MNAGTRALALERLRSSPRPRVLFVSHEHGGGVARHVGDLVAMLAAQAEALVLQPHGAELLALREPGRADGLTMGFRACEWEALIAVLAAIGIDRVHFHHVHGLPQAALDLGTRLAAPYDVTLHDHFPICPAYHLRDGTGRFCGGEPGCGHCLESGPACWGLSIAQWRETFAAFLARAERVIAPSAALAQRLARHFPGIEARVWAHPERPSAAFTSPLRVLVPGAISAAKGLALLEACARDAAERRLPLHFRVLGFVAHAPGHWPTGPISITGEYPEATLAELIALERGDVAFFPAQCPETFSYTLSAVLETDLPIVATDLGALPERLAARANARIVPWDAPAGRFNDALLDSAPARRVQAHRTDTPVTFEAYRARYLEGWPVRSRGGRGSLAAVASSGALALPERRQTGTLEFLFEDGVRCGRAASLEALARAVREADARLADADTREVETAARAKQARGEAAACAAECTWLREEIARMNGESQRLGAALAEAQARLRTLERSRSWRITAPLRALARWWARRG